MAFSYLARRELTAQSIVPHTVDTRLLDYPCGEAGNSLLPRRERVAERACVVVG